MIKHFYPARMWFKTVSLTVAVLLLCSQFDPAFGQGLKVNLSKEYLRTLEPELGPGYSAKDLVNRSNAARSRVEQDNLIEDFRQNGKNENSSETSDATAIQENLTVALDSIQDNAHIFC